MLFGEAAEKFGVVVGPIGEKGEGEGGEVGLDGRRHVSELCRIGYTAISMTICEKKKMRLETCCACPPRCACPLFIQEASHGKEPSGKIRTAICGERMNRRLGRVKAAPLPFDAAENDIRIFPKGNEREKVRRNEELSKQTQAMFYMVEFVIIIHRVTRVNQCNEVERNPRFIRGRANENGGRLTCCRGRQARKSGCNRNCHGCCSPLYLRS
jgi:hypothetical protein